MAEVTRDKSKTVKINMREGKSNAQARKIKKYNEKSDETSHVDLAPMVDIAFLLLTFFMLTTSFAKPNVFQMGLPEPPKPNAAPSAVDPKLMLTIQVSKTGKDGVFLLRGIEKEGNTPAYTKFEELRAKVKAVRDEIQNDPSLSKYDVVTAVKIHPDAKYDDMIEVMNEIFDAGVRKWATVELKTDEAKKLEELEAKVKK